MGRPALFVVAAMVLAGCAHGRAIPRNALVQRARDGVESAPSERGLDVVAFARSQVGKRYCWGGTGPACYDCSGLAYVAWRRAGVVIPRTSEDIADALPEVPLEDVRAGDILWWPGHVGIYAGGGWLVDALNARRGVVRRRALDPYRAFRPPQEWGSPPSTSTSTATKRRGRPDPDG